MSDNRKYYYLKLKENYFDDDSIVLLESMQDGVLYPNILLKLYLKSLKHGGRLQLDEDITYAKQTREKFLFHSAFSEKPCITQRKGKGNQKTSENLRPFCLAPC